MKGRIELPLSSDYLSIPIRIREQFLDAEAEAAECMLIGDALQITVFGDEHDLVLRAELSEWATGKPRQRKLNNNCGIYVHRWLDVLNVASGDDGKYVPAMAMTPDPDQPLRPPSLDSRDGLTFAEAERLVDRYIRKNRDRRTVVRSPDIARANDIELSSHNLIRIHDALDSRCEVRKDGGAKAKQFKIP